MSKIVLAALMALASSAVAQPGGGAAPLAFTPTTGLWWNPNESGTGYNVEVQKGVLVVTMYSYTAAGDPVSYLAVGSMMNGGSGVTASGTLDKYRGGQPRLNWLMHRGSITSSFRAPSAQLSRRR